MTTATLTRDKKSLLAQKILSIASSDKEQEELIVEIVKQIQSASGIEAVGLRLADGLDYPYYFTNGFDHDFVQKEMFLCCYDETGDLLNDSAGNPVLECMCGNIICGRTDPSKPFFTDGGSFWTNSTTDLLASTTEADRQARTRNRCNGEGYESVALIPIKSGNRTHGLLQLNDRQRGRFTPEDIVFYEGIGGIVGIVFTSIKAKLQVLAKTDDILRLTAVRMRTLEKIAALLKEGEYADKQYAVVEKLDSLLDEIKKIRGIIPICSTCKKVRSDTAYWEQIESYVSSRTDARFSHTFCPECHRKFMEEEGL